MPPYEGEGARGLAILIVATLAPGKDANSTFVILLIFMFYV